MMKNLAFSTLGCPAWDFETIVKNAAEMGFSAIEVRGIGQELRAEKLPCFLPENRRQTRELLKRYGVRICGLNTSCCFHDAGALEASLAEGRTALALCRDMKIGAIRVFGDSLAAGDRDEIIRQAAEGLSSLCSEAEAAGFVQVLLEVHGDFNTIEVYSKLLPQMAGHPSFGLIWDIEHSFRAYGRDYREFYHLIRPYIRHVHVKDCRIENGELKIEKLGDGQINVPEIIAELAGDGYPGFYSFEWEKRWHPDIPDPEEAFPAYVSFMNQIWKEICR